MGGKKKIKWKKVPPEELSHITVKRSESDRIRTKEQFHSSESNTRPTSSRKQDPRISFNNRDSIGEDLDSTSYDDVNSCRNLPISITSEQSGSYVNGLWIPQQQINTENQIPNDISYYSELLNPACFEFRDASMYYTTSYPMIQLLPISDAPIHYNFIPSNNHYTDCFVNFQTGRQCNEFLKIQVNDFPVEFSHTSIGYMPFLENRLDHGEAVPFQAQQSFEDYRIQHNNNPTEDYGDIVTTYQYSGHGFGHAVYSIPFYPVLSQNVQLQSAESWSSVTHSQKSRQLRRKGYAEYAAIPHTKNNSKSHDEKAKQFMPDNEIKSAKNDRDEKYSKVKYKFLLDKGEKNSAAKNNILSFNSIKGLSYTRHLIDEIITSALKEIKKNLTYQKFVSNNRLKAKNWNEDQHNYIEEIIIKECTSKIFADKMEFNSETGIKSHENHQGTICVHSEDNQKFTKNTENFNAEELNNNIAPLHLSNKCEINTNDINENSIKIKHLGSDHCINNSAITPVFHDTIDYPAIKKISNDIVNLENLKSEGYSKRYFSNEQDEREVKNDSIPSQSSYVSLMVSSEVLIRETELELKKLHQLTSKSSLQKNQSIYKLAYDESLTDQSESEEIDLNQQQDCVVKQQGCPQACRKLQGDLGRSEILVHEADSESDAGSEDVELLPHRYASESAQRCDKHIYVNNLSLAVEMLRTRESLPYDDEFKRIVEDNPRNQNELSTQELVAHERKPGIGRVNPSFIEDNSYMNALTITQFPGSINAISSNTECSIIAVEKGSESTESQIEEICQDVRETFSNEATVYDAQKQQNKKHDGSANYRRLGNQARQQFSIYSPRTSMVNPCLCCIIM